MRLLPGGVAALVVLGLTACAASVPVDLAADPAAGPAAESVETASATPSSGATTGVPDAPAAGNLPAPAQRQPVPAATGSGGAAGPASPAQAVTQPPTPTAPAPAATLHADPGSLDVVVNKRRPLEPLDYAPADLRQPDVAIATANALLRPDTAAAVEEMFAAAAADGVGLVMVSGYRSYADQESTYASWVSQYGGAAGADTVSARPGFSEHQTGLAFDIAQTDGACTLVSCFAQTAAARWAAENAADHGVILRYPLGFHGITGFSAEPWHFRFVGRDVSLAMQADGTRTLEEHFGLPAAPTY